MSTTRVVPSVARVAHTFSGPLGDTDTGSSRAPGENAWVNSSIP